MQLNGGAQNSGGGEKVDYYCDAETKHVIWKGDGVGILGSGWRHDIFARKEIRVRYHIKRRNFSTNPRSD